MDLEDENSNEDNSEALRKLFEIINLDDRTKLDKTTSEPSWRHRNDTNEENSRRYSNWRIKNICDSSAIEANSFGSNWCNKNNCDSSPNKENSPGYSNWRIKNICDSSTNEENSFGCSNWRNKNISDSSEATESWRTKQSGDTSRSWKYQEKRINQIDRCDKDEDLWRIKRAVLRIDNEGDSSDDESHNKQSTYKQKSKSYQDKGRTAQTVPRRNTYRNSCSPHLSLSLRKVLQLETEEVPEKVILALVDKLEAFKQIIGGSLSFEDVVLLLRVFNKICSSHFDENRAKLIISIVNGNFLPKISQYLLLLAAQDFDDKNENMFFWGNPEQFWNNLLKLYENIFEFMPSTACDVLPKIVKATIISINDAERYQEVQLSTDVRNKLKKLQETLTNYTERQNNVEIEPPNSFRMLSIYPSVEEITTREVPFIRPIIKNGAYQSVEHYLDVHFRLLKEDFTASLRNGICTYLHKEENQESKQQYDVRIYENVHFISPFIRRDRVATLLQYTTKINKKDIEESSKRFIYGSLLCFTANNFKDIALGTVVDNDKKYLKKGQIIVDIREGRVELNKNYTMVECTVFFEPYYQVLMAMKKINEDNFPFKDYIIDVTSNIKPPKYIKETTVARFMEDRYKFKILAPETWPRCDQVNLNESQFKAFQLALTQEFCIIQGPPGTGKTYTTLRIVEFLLRNKFSLAYNGPIFVICFTNHALDQFLEGILPHTNYLLRVGGQSKNETMKKYSLYKYRRLLRKAQNRARKRAYGDWSSDDDYSSDEEKYDFSDYRHTRNEGAKEYYALLHEVEDYQNYLTDIVSFTGIMHFKTLKKYGDIERFSWFGRRSDEQMIDWLLEHDEPIDTKEVEEAFEEEQSKEDDSEYYFQHDELYNDRKLIEDIFGSISESSASVNKRFQITPKDFQNNIDTYEHKIEELDEENELHDELYLKYRQLIRLNSKKMRYLAWRLKQCKTQTEVEETPPDMTVPPEEMKPDDRWKLYRHWLHLLRMKLCVMISTKDERLRRSHRVYQEVAQLRDIYIMQKMRVIGMTTTGAAKHQKILQTLKCPIVIAEEAAEVLESHIVASLTEHCQHLILIGDHQQLRPNTAQYKLATEYNLEISLFERMVKNGIHCQQLNIQHRMRPEIAKLIVPAIYPNLANSPSVENFAPIRGVTKSLFFINHAVHEDEINNSTSHMNMYEAKYVIRLASYFIKQGYKPEEITILATYKGQMYLLLQEKNGRAELDGVRITVVDNFQGEENKIILLSLVRSNTEASIGFLKIENRVCVALSRAKEGFFIIGNMNNLERKSAIWPKIKKALVEQDAIGATLTLQCQNHETKTIIRTWKDFAQVSAGGCNIPCNTKLNCGHICQFPCHPYDQGHEEYVCKEKCTKTCPRGHPCKEQCYSKCSPCHSLLKTNLPCGHIQSIPCSVKPNEYHCKAKVEATFPCGHNGTKKCHEDPKSVKCLHPCEKVLNCGHICQSLCHIQNDPEHLTYKCKEPCVKFKKGCSTNEHICSRKCFEECEPCTELIKKRRSTCTHKVRVQCNEEIGDSVCREKCRKILPCGHYCPKLCFEECGNCPVMVTKIIESCGHSITTECRNQVDRTMCQNDQCSPL